MSDEPIDSMLADARDMCWFSFAVLTVLAIASGWAAYLAWFTL